ncbi:Uncharacterised protein [uncultured Eubacterium sp.]|nr:Uncharacterised protein [uncultured Eubacterium sp.]
MKIYGMLFTVIIGILLHFTYVWSDRSPFIAVVAPVDGSVFQQLKLLYTPYMLWALIEYEHYGQFTKNFIPVKAVTLFAGMMVLILLLYLSAKVLRRNVPWIDLTVFMLSTLAVFYTDYHLTESGLSVMPAATLSGSLLLFLIAMAMSVFTFYPPDHPLFSDRYRSLN